MKHLRRFAEVNAVKRILLCAALALLLVCLALGFLAGRTAGPDYGARLFDAGFVHQVDIRIAEEDWADLLENPADKTKYKVNVCIDGEVLEEVSFSTKGNSSLVFVAADPDSIRYSFRVKFGKYVKGQTYHGLDSLSLNNGLADATYMKDRLSYEIFRQAGVPAPLTSYVWLTVNGRDHGLYLAAEDIGEGYLSRVHGGKGVIYKPESAELDLSVDDVADIRENGVQVAVDPHGADLVYTDDDPESYPDIFENAETEATEQDDRAVIRAMKNLAEGTDLSACLDTDEIIRYFAAHNFILNYDSYTSGMLHNLVLYENRGAVALIPWDYNLGFGTFAAVIGEEILEDASGILNLGIDSPLIGAEEDRRPMWKWIVRDEGYRKEYHDRLDELVAGYFESGECEREIGAMQEMLLPYVEKDPTAFYTAEEFSAACEALKQFCALRAESIRRQLDGSLPAVTGLQPEGDRVDIGSFSLRPLGTTADWD